MENKNVLITGISGFVGKHLARFLLSKNAKVIGTYRSESSKEALNEFKDSVVLKKVDLMDADAVVSLLQSEKPDYIVHLAAQASPSKSFSAPAETITVNTVATLNILEGLKKHEMKSTRLLLVSTGEMYGMVKPSDLPIDEDTPLRPISPYSVSKITQDYLAYQYFLAYHLDIVRVRPFNHIGPGQKEGFVVADFAKQIIEIEHKQKDPELSVGNLEGKRDFTDVRDIVRAYGLALEKGEAGEVYNLGSGVSRKIADVLQALLDHAKETVEVKPDPARFRPIDVPEIVCDYQKFNKLTGWKPEIPFEKTVQDILDYWRQIV